MRKFYTLLLALLFLCLFPLAYAEPPSIVPRGHAHNDYRHARPLLDALEQGFGSVEADIFLVDGVLLVAHNVEDVKPERTLEALYLEPLRSRVEKYNGKVQPGLEQFILLIDIKSDGEATYQALKPLLEKYRDMFAGIVDGKPKPGPVMVVLSGDSPLDTLARETSRLAAIDGRPANLGRDHPSHLIPLISDSWGNHFKWAGTGPMPEDERAYLRDLVARVHGEGRMLRFWATPDRPEIWAEQVAACVDLINADNLSGFRAYLAQKTGSETSVRSKPRFSK